jgi:two-component system, OmpR family, response regulator
VRILVVDDDVRLARSLKRGFEADGFATDVAPDGPTALWLAGESDYDAIVLDVMLPGLDGHELCRRLRAAGNWSPILMLTARTGTAEEVHSLDSGADDFLPKPFSYAVLVARLRALIRRGRGERPTTLTVGDLVLDPATREITRSGTAISLTPRQFSLLEFLMRRPGEVVSKTEILEHVWDFAYTGPANIVEVYVHQLRQRIDIPFGRNSLQTVRLVGYRLAEEP